MNALAPSPDEPVDVLETPIKDVICQSDVSVRLTNALINAGNDLPFYTVREYLEAGPTAKNKFLTIPNLGRRSANELDEIVRAFIASAPREIVKAPREMAEPVPQPGATLNAVRRSLVDLFSAFRFPEVFLEGVISTRLANALHSNPDLACPLSEFLDGIERVCAELRSLGNVGRISTSELLDLAKEFTATTLKTAGFPDEAIADAHAVIFERRISSDDALAHLQAVLMSARPISLDDGRAYTACEIVAQIMQDLHDRDRAVLERRYGFLTGKVETLEEIAVDYQVTRERIRQIEAKNLKRISRSKLAKALRFAFDREIAARLMTATENLGYIKDGQKTQIILRLAAADRFAIDILYDDRDKFLRKCAARWHGGWILPPLVKEELQEILREAKTRISSLSLPAAFSEFAAGMPLNNARVAVELGTDLSIFEGYLIAGRVGARPQRTIRLHRCLAAAAGILEIGDLITRYRQAAPNDKHSSVRDAMIVMLMAPHLFLGVFDRHWYALGQAGSTDETSVGRDNLQEQSVDEDAVPLRPHEEGIRALLRHLLLAQGPLRFVDLREQAARRLRGKSPLSVGPTLLTSGEFVRPLPGIYAVPEQIPAGANILFDPPKFLLAEEQVKYLAEARYAEEPFGRFPMWIPEAEYVLCRWAQGHCNPLLYQSLLAVASIDLWPVSPQEREHWSGLKRTQSRYCLAAPPRYPIRQLWPPLDRLLAACVVANQNNGLSWIAANRVLKRRLDAHVSPGLLALMVSLGALQAPSQWQMFHKAGQRLTDIVQNLSRCLHEQGALDWNSSVGEKLLEELPAARRVPKSGWVDADVVEDLIIAARQRAVASLPTAGEADESTSSFEDLLREVAQSHELEAAHQTMHAVLGRQD